MAIEDEVKKASSAFYEAMTRCLNGEPGPLFAIWSHGPETSAVHPLGDQEIGWNQVKTGIAGTCAVISNGQVSVSDLVVFPITPDVAYTIGNEHMEANIGSDHLRAQGRATDIYRQEAGQWKIVHHHTDLDANAANMFQRHKGQQKAA